MPEGTTATAASSEGTDGTPAPDGATNGTDDKAVAGTKAPDAGTGQQPEEVGLSAEAAQKLRNENAALRRKQKDADKAADEQRKAALSEAERLAEDRAQFDRDKADLATERRDLKVRTATALTANRVGAIYPDVIEAMVLSRMSEVEFDDAGAPTNIEVVLTDIKRSHPNLFRAGVGSADGGASGRKTPPASSVNDAIRRAAGR
jgi:hypothetical protein